MGIPGILDGFQRWFRTEQHNDNTPGTLIVPLLLLVGTSLYRRCTFPFFGLVNDVFALSTIRGFFSDFFIPNELPFHLTLKLLCHCLCIISFFFEKKIKKL